MAEGARLESVYTCKRIEGSNPSLSAKLFEPLKLPETWTANARAQSGFLPLAPRLYGYKTLPNKSVTCGRVTGSR